MADRVRPLKYESPGTGGDETDTFLTEVDPTEDYIDCKGVAFGSENVRVEAIDNEIAFVDGSGVQKLSEVSGGVGAHNTFDTLLHAIAENCTYEIIRSAGRVQYERWKNGPTMIREIEYLRIGVRVSAIVYRHYDAAGALLQTLTETLTRVNGKVVGSTMVLS